MIPAGTRLNVFRRSTILRKQFVIITIRTIISRQKLVYVNHYISMLEIFRGTIRQFIYIKKMQNLILI